jgi:hypothetical protein
MIMNSIAIDTLDRYELEQLRDSCNCRLLLMHRIQGLTLIELLELLEEVKTTLRDQGKEWYSLERWQWIDGEIRFWLNPCDQQRYRMGWFALDDLIAWTHDLGLIVADAAHDIDDQVEDIIA